MTIQDPANPTGGSCGSTRVAYTRLCTCQASAPNIEQLASQGLAIMEVVKGPEGFIPIGVGLGTRTRARPIVPVDDFGAADSCASRQDVCRGRHVDGLEQISCCEWWCAWTRDADGRGHEVTRSSFLPSWTLRWKTHGPALCRDPIASRGSEGSCGCTDFCSYRDESSDRSSSLSLE